MNRHRILGFALLAAWPAVAPAQSPKELLDLLSKGASKPLNYQDLIDLNYFRAAGWRAITKGYYDTAEHEFASAIKVAKRPGLDEPSLTARSYADYAWALQKQGRNAEAEPLLKWALVAREASLPAGSTSIAQTLNQLGTLYYEAGRPADAEPALRRAVEVLAKASKPDGPEQARSLTLLGLLYSSQRRYAEAEPAFAGALAAREKALGPSSPDTGDAASNLAWTCHEQGKNDLARPLFERALRIFERARGEDDPSVAHAADGLGRISAAQGKPAEAEAFFQRAIAILERRPYEEPSLFEVLRHYADLLDDEGRSADLDRVKARLAPLRAKYTGGPVRLGTRYRVPDPPKGPGPNAGRVSG